VGSPQGLVLLTSLLLIDSLHFVFARLLLPHSAPATAALYVIVIATLEVGLFGLLTRRLQLAPLLRHWHVFIGIGLCVAISTNLNYAAVAYIDPGSAAMVSRMTIPFGLGFGLLWLKDRLKPQQVMGTLIALVGLAVISFQPGTNLRLGAFMVLAATLLYALHSALTKRYMGGIDLLNFFFYRMLLTASFLVLISGVQGDLVLPTKQALPLLLATATVDIAISRSLYYWALYRLDMSVFSVVLAASPVAAIVWSLFLFDILPNNHELLGGVGILAGVALVTAAPMKRKPGDPEK